MGATPELALRSPGGGCVSERKEQGLSSLAPYMLAPREEERGSSVCWSTVPEGRRLTVLGKVIYIWCPVG